MKLNRKIIGICLGLILVLQMSMASSVFAKDGLYTIVYDNEMHHIDLDADDPYFPETSEDENYRFVVYCMNDRLAWPHYTGSNGNPPQYVKGYLTRDMFDSDEEFEEVNRKLALILFAGYPNNSVGLYEIGKGDAITVEAFNRLLVPSEELMKAFPELRDYQFTYDKLNDKEQVKRIQTFNTSLVNFNSSEGLTKDKVKSTDFYKAAVSMFLAEQFVSTDPIDLYEKSYSADFYVSEREAYEATQNAVWYLMNKYNVPFNNKTDALSSNLAVKIYNFAEESNVEMYEGHLSNDEIEISDEIVFSFDEESGKYVSNKFSIHAPESYPKFFKIKLPEGISVVGTSDDRIVKGGTYQLESETLPETSVEIEFTSIGMKFNGVNQYTPSGETDANAKFQRMTGAIVEEEPLVKLVGSEFIPNDDVSDDGLGDEDGDEVTDGEAPSDVPSTGDYTNLPLMAALIVVALVALFAVVRIRRND